MSRRPIQESQIDTNDDLIVLHRAPFQVYQVNREKLEQIETASRSGNDDLALGISLLTLGFSSAITFFTTEVKFEWMNYVLAAVAFVGSPVGLLFLRRWFKEKTAVSRIIQGIFDLPAENIKPFSKSRRT